MAQELAISLIAPSFQRGLNLPEGVSLAYPGNVFHDDNRHLLECSASLALGYTFDIKFLSRGNEGDSLMVQWLRICLPMQGTRVRSLVWEDPTCRRATKPVHHNY